MRRIIPVALFLLVLGFIVAPVTFSQTTCVQVGQIFDCSGPNHYSATQVPFGPKYWGDYRQIARQLPIQS